MGRMTALCFAAFLSAAAPPPRAGAAERGGKGDLEVAFGVETGRLFGATLYRIAVPTGDGLVESELEWSLDSWLAGFTASLQGEGPWSAELSLFTNLSGGSGSMEDSDRVNGVLFVFSESEVEADAFSSVLVDLAGTYRFIRRPTWTLGGTAGLLYQHFDLRAANLEQFSPVGLSEFDATVAGPVVTYSVTYTIPYAGAALFLSLTPRMSLTLKALAGYAVGADEDDHLLRFKLSQAETDGLALMGRASAAYSFTPRFSLTASLEALSVETSGEQDQFFYAGPDAGTKFTGIFDEIDTRQVLVTLEAGYRF